MATDPRTSFDDCDDTKRVLGGVAVDLKPEIIGIKRNENTNYFARISVSSKEVHRILTLVVIGLLSWGLAYVICGPAFGLDGDWFRLALTAVAGYVFGQLLQRITSLPSLWGAFVTGIVFANLGIVDIDQNRSVDNFLRKIYPVVILGKSALGVNYTFMKKHIRRLLGFGIFPWATEVVALAVCARYLLNFSWEWGFLLATMATSPSPAVPMPIVQRLYSKDLGVTHDLPQLVSTAGIIDTTLSVGAYGILLSAIFSQDDQYYVIMKGSLTVFVGVGLGIAWGYLVSILPYKTDKFIDESRFVIVLLGGLLVNFGTLAITWGGTGGLAVIFCNMTAANLWKKSNCKVKHHPIATAYRILWNICEPVVFAFSGAQFMIYEFDIVKLLTLLGILAAGLMIRMSTGYLVAWKCGLRVKERIYYSFTLMPKAILEARQQWVQFCLQTTQRLMSVMPDRTYSSWPL